jgi:6,7-dimethyl-8-ribityllumazine synthase
VIVRGETHHASLIAEQVARGVMDVQLTENIPFVFEVLSVDDIAHAKQRAGSTVNRGADAARAALYSLAKLASIRS